MIALLNKTFTAIFSASRFGSLFNFTSPWKRIEAWKTANSRLSYYHSAPSILNNQCLRKFSVLSTRNKSKIWSKICFLWDLFISNFTHFIFWKRMIKFWSMVFSNESFQNVAGKPFCSMEDFKCVFTWYQLEFVPEIFSLKWECLFIPSL